LEMGYLLVRAPDELAHLRGHHRCAWAQFLQRLGLTQQEWASRRAQFYTPKYTTHDVMESIWRDQGLQLPVPVDPGVQHQHIAEASGSVDPHAEHNRRNMAVLRSLDEDDLQHLSGDFHPSQRPQMAVDPMAADLLQDLKRIPGLSVDTMSATVQLQASRPSKPTEIVITATIGPFPDSHDALCGSMVKRMEEVFLTKVIYYAGANEATITAYSSPVGSSVFLFCIVNPTSPGEAEAVRNAIKYETDASVRASVRASWRLGSTGTKGGSKGSR